MQQMKVKISLDFALCQLRISIRALFIIGAGLATTRDNMTDAIITLFDACKMEMRP